MNISVIISSYRGNEALTRACIESLNAQTLLPSEIIVVLDTLEEQGIFTRFLIDRTSIPLKIEYSGKKGLAAARNKGIGVSSGEIVAFIDDDAVADNDWLSHISTTFEQSNEAGVVGGPVTPVFDGEGADEKFYWIIGCTGTNPPSDRPIGCNMAFRRDIFKRIGSFDENLGRIQKKLAVGEETELFLRIQKHLPEYSIVFNPDARVFHITPPHRLTLRYFIRRAYQEGYSKARIRKSYQLHAEEKFLRYYIRHPDFRTVCVVAATGAGYLAGNLHGAQNI